ncbi:MAG: tetratricopeptide repeat protein [Planctomycetes bacterium]|nr:tetratricopeptide repeat protein [Planctomycetota bacterium]
MSRTVFAAPLENQTGEGQYDPAAAGLADLVAVLLAGQEHVTVVERQRLLALTGEQALSLKGLTGEKHSLAAGRLLKADTVLTGRLYLVEGKLTVNLQAIDIASERVLAADQASFRPADLMETALQLARGLGRQMALPLPEIDLKALDASPIASLHFAKALSHYYAGHMDAAIMQFMRTMDLDPDYTEAHFWQGMCHQRLGEHAHAVIEWEEYLARHPDSERSDAVRKLLDEAKRLDAQGSPERLGPKVPAKAPPRDGPGQAGPASPATKPQPPDPAKDPAEAARIRAHSALQLGVMLEKAGKPKAARREYDRVVKEHPDTEEAKEARRRLDALDAAAGSSPK